MRITINGEAMFRPRLVLGSMGTGMDTSIGEFLLPGDLEGRMLTVDLSEEEVEAMSFLALVSYMVQRNK